MIFIRIIEYFLIFNDKFHVKMSLITLSLIEVAAPSNKCIIIFLTNALNCPPFSLYYIISL